MKFAIKSIIVILILLYRSSLFSQEIKLSKPSELIKPILFANLGEKCQIVKGVTLDKKINLYQAITKKASLKGMEFGPYENIYLMDNQFFTRNENFSRLIRVIV